MLLERGADVHCQNDLLRTPLHLAAFNGHQTAITALLKHGQPDPNLGDYCGKTAFNIATDFGSSRLEIALALKNYAKLVYAPNITSILVSVDKEQDDYEAMPDQEEEEENEDEDKDEENSSPPFVFLPRLGSGALSLIAKFLASEQVDAVAALAATQTRLGAQPARTPASVSKSNARFAVFSPVRSYDPRSRSLPYLLRQAEEAESKN
mmetsp:Transcript_45814/g.58837  ORF Transcript_45814/g.58837 Transcript_45814/m.58837 type:complete len:208 (+) Transcript_45814:32-655(+)